MLFGASTAALSGDVNVTSRAKSGQKKADTKKNLRDFGKDNSGN